MHEDHRQRMRARFLAEGLGSFADHNVLEILLFFSIPRRDTNEIAHRLLERFGSLNGVFDADIHDLEAVNGIGEYSAFFIKLLQAFVARYEADKFAHAPVRLNTLRETGRYLVSKYITETIESPFLLLLSADYSLIACERLASGSVNTSPILSRQIIQLALAHNASLAILAHNHPGGVPTPSGADIAMTHFVEQALAAVDVELVEHIIVAGTDYEPIKHQYDGNRNHKFIGNKLVISQFYEDFDMTKDEGK